jgi:hypothetical protein
LHDKIRISRIGKLGKSHIMVVSCNGLSAGAAGAGCGAIMEQRQDRPNKEVAMLLALLYQREGNLAAAAPACDQQPLGDRYWRTVYPEPLELRGSETAYVAIDDAELVDRLLRMNFRDGIAAAEAVDAYLGLAGV